ncbi:MAG TPA: 3-dehydroquinate synthase [Casimicrobiaceae bacterium]|nr:3-dehydroquinate synthase [Casimicrobiaceae bacterium]
MITVDVGLGERSYPIHIGSGFLREAAARLPLARGARAVIVSNPIVARLHLATLRKSFDAAGIRIDTVLVPDGETHKDAATLNDLLTRLLELGTERGTLLIALGGGVVGDLAGFAAAIYQRGIAFVQVPTTLLAQVDSSVGGKTGINHPLGKNMIGAFWQPRAVLIDVDCLATLPDRELRAGLAEVIKYGAIRDGAFFAWLEGAIGALVARDGEALVHAIERSCAIKAAVVAADEREAGERAILNFGHTFGHAIEAVAGYGNWLHGEAVAAGMVCAARLSARSCGLRANDVARLEALVRAAGLPVAPPAIPTERWLEAMRRDKKVEGGALRFVLIDALGHALVRSDVAEADVMQAIAEASIVR